MVKKSPSKAAAEPALTPVRQAILNIIRSHNRPVGAYALLAEYKKNHPKAAPPTIYRALDYLIDHHHIHKIEKLNAYVACNHHHDTDVQFMICNRCGKTREVDAVDVHKSTGKLAKKLDFVIEHSIVEIIGHCMDCRP